VPPPPQSIEFGFVDPCRFIVSIPVAVALVFLSVSVRVCVTVCVTVGLVQSYAARQKWTYTTLGQFKHSLHFIVSLPSDVLLTEFLTSTIEKLLKQAGFQSWSFPEGCSEPDVNFNVERYLTFDRKWVLPCRPPLRVTCNSLPPFVSNRRCLLCATCDSDVYRERLLSEAGVGWVRLYPTGVGSFEGIVQNVGVSLVPRCTPCPSHSGSRLTGCCLAVCRLTRTWRTWVGWTRQRKRA
jgi:hypothetical protein